MMRVGAIDNPHSQRNKQRASGLEAAGREVEGFCYARLDDMADLPAILADLAHKDLELLVISGGDGTVQAVLTELIEARPFERLPVLAILPRGMTNMTASDIGIGGDKGLRRLFELCRSGELSGHFHRRHLLRLENIRDYGPQVGMFFGGAGIYRAIETCRQSIHSLKFESELANGLTLAALLLRWLFTRGRNDQVLKGDRADIKLDDEVFGERDYLLFLATTLDRLVLRSRPFWNIGGRPIRYTSIAYPPRRLLRSARRVLYGGDDRRLPSDCYLSRGAERVELTLSSPFTLDGQLFEPDPAHPLVLTARHSADFVKL